MKEKGSEYGDRSEDDDVHFRMIHVEAELCNHPLIVDIEFPERPGAFLEFMEHIGDIASLCYFNYAYSGERVGRALVGMEFDSEEDREVIKERLQGFPGTVIRAIREISPTAGFRIMGN